jgi:hypothetical protein
VSCRDAIITVARLAIRLAWAMTTAWQEPPSLAVWLVRAARCLLA